jgi:hypothetical protein
MERLDDLDDPGVEGAPPVLEQAAVRHFVGQGVLEGVLEIGKQAHLVEKLASLERRETVPQDILGHLGNGLENRKGHILADDCGRLEKAFLFDREPVDPSGQDRLDRRRDLDAWQGEGEAVGAALSSQRPRLDQRADALFQEERVPFGALDQDVLERPKRGVRAQERAQQGLGAVGRQGIEPELRIVRLAAPAVRVLGAIVHEEEHPGRRQALD